MKLILRVELILLMVASLPALAAVPAERYDLKIPAAQAREVLVSILENRRLAPEAQQPATAALLKLLRSYRQDASSSRLPIARAPFATYAAADAFDSAFVTAYNRAYPEELAHASEAMNAERIFDELLKLTQGPVPSGTPEAISAAVDQIGPCLGKKALHARGPECALEAGDGSNAPGAIQLAATKVSCPLNLVGDCQVRRMLWAAAQPSITTLQQDGTLAKLIQEKFDELFPRRFRDGFLDEFSGKLSDFGRIARAKFGAGQPGQDEGEFWDKRTPLVEGDSGDSSQITTRGFARGLQADSAMAELLAASSLSSDRGSASALAYASANRLMLMTGGEELSLDDDGNLALQPGDAFDPAHPKQAPRIVRSRFGGWSYSASAAPAFSVWDWAGYDPTATPATPFALFTETLALGARGIPGAQSSAAARESLEDVGALIEGMIDYLESTRPGSSLAPRYGELDDPSRLLDPSAPVLFPREARFLAFGILGGAAKNLAAPLGHIETTDTGTRIVFHERVGLAGRDPGAPSTRAVAGALIAAARLMQLLRAPDDATAVLPPEAKAAAQGLIPTLADALQIGTLALGAQAQGGDGGFTSRLDGASAGTVADTVAGMRALARSYGAIGVPVLLSRLQSGFKFLESRWPAGAPAPAGIDARTAWQLLNLGAECRGAILPQLAGQLNPAAWEARFQSLRSALLAQLETQSGPQGF
jgi:hypothetical protein